MIGDVDGVGHVQTILVLALDDVGQFSLLKRFMSWCAFLNSLGGSRSKKEMVQERWARSKRNVSRSSKKEGQNKKKWSRKG